MRKVPAIRIRQLVDAPPRAEGSFVLYWMTATRRLEWNFALDHALHLAKSLGKPLLIFEAVSVAYPWASDRHHQALLDGMGEHREALSHTSVAYYPYVERRRGSGRGLLSSLAASACFVVTDDSLVFLNGRLLQAAGRLEGVGVQAVDSCGLLPLRAAERTFTAAYHFRRFLHKSLPEHLGDAPSRAPLSQLDLLKLASLPEPILYRWSPASAAELESRYFVSTLPIDHSVAATSWVGGAAAGRAALNGFVRDRLPRYFEDRNHPDRDGASGLSPWLHYGHLSSHEVFQAVIDAEGWSPLRLSEKADGRRNGWWGMSEPAEAFLDQLITWRELGYGYSAHQPDGARYEALPEWARNTLEDHVADRREYTYSLGKFAGAETHDDLWNAAQRQLVQEGRIHNYLRMLWGKKILEWTEHPREALDVMIELNNRYAIDGRDPNSDSGIFWVMGRFDRGWPERPVFGKVRSMTSKSTRRKVDLEQYLAKWADRRPGAHAAYDPRGRP
ncbi:MAG: deoxyribodipyrimidine photolyase [Gemmatimonadetes bacterium]|nr:deoxyribodipyrimidine photolyase [Gemmatimonadota bacterium]MDA1104749.1 deoxyribodipyrimidine photolyase [Gemmatimonadota bacterium]